MNNKKILLTILDGWGIGPVPSDSAIANAKTPYVDKLLAQYPNATLNTFGLHVGLPEGQMGNSEVGHMNIGAGRIVYQDLVKINLDIENKQLEKKVAIIQGIQYAKEHGKSIHLLGLVSDGGVHSHIEHLKALCTILSEAGVPAVHIHAFTDGRDTDPESGVGFIRDLQQHNAALPNVHLASLIGRYYAMDRDKRWERVKKAYDLLVHGAGQKSRDIIDSMLQSYDLGVTDEFIEPIVMVDEHENPVGKIESGDVVLFYNFRSDRPREVTTVLTQKDMPEFGMHTLPLHYITMTPYDESYKNVHIIYAKDNLNQTLGELLADAGKTQLRIAETEKYPHVTFFFNGGREDTFQNEKRIMIPSPKVATYDLKPEMSAPEVADAAIAEMKLSAPDFICLNFANSDMVGHTGDFSAAIKAAETVDLCLNRLIEQAKSQHYDVLIIADHGNSDVMRNPDGSPNTAHSLSPVPVIWVGEQTNGYRISPGKLADIAPTILYLMDIPQPKIMTGLNLISKV